MSRSSGVRQRGQAPPRSRAGMKRPVCTPPLRIASRTAARSSRRSRSSSSTDSSPATAAGESRARHSVSSASRLPTPAITPWSSSRAFSAVVPRPTRSRKTSRPTSAASGPDVREVRVDHRAAEPPLVAQRHPAAVGELEREAVPVAAAPRPRRPRSGPPSRGAARGRGRRRSRPTGTSRAGARASAGGRSARRRSRPAGAGGRRRCRGRRRRRSRGPARARSAAARARPREARASAQATAAISRGSAPRSQVSSSGPPRKPARRSASASAACARPLRHGRERLRPRRAGACPCARGARPPAMRPLTSSAGEIQPCGRCTRALNAPGISASACRVAAITYWSKPGSSRTERSGSAAAALGDVLAQQAASVRPRPSPARPRRRAPRASARPRPAPCPTSAPGPRASPARRRQ